MVPLWTVATKLVARQIQSLSLPLTSVYSLSHVSLLTTYSAFLSSCFGELEEITKIQPLLKNS